jgi:hypothetical protein
MDPGLIPVKAGFLIGGLAVGSLMINLDGVNGTATKR